MYLCSYLISRALGPRLGGAVGLLYYIGVALLAVMEVKTTLANYFFNEIFCYHGLLIHGIGKNSWWQGLGSVEMLVFTFPKLDFPNSNRIIGAVILLILGALVRVIWGVC
jgi:potassium/chloride transporter 4/5/6